MTRFMSIDVFLMVVLLTTQITEAKLRKIQAKLDVAVMDIIDVKKELDDVRSKLNVTDSVLEELTAKECKSQERGWQDGNPEDVSVLSNRIEQIEKNIHYVLRGVEDEKLKTDSEIKDFRKSVDVIIKELITRFEMKFEKQQDALNNFIKVNTEAIRIQEKLVSDKLDQIETKYEQLKDEMNTEFIQSKYDVLSKTYNDLNITVKKLLESFAAVKVREDCYSIKKDWPNSLSGVYDVWRQDIGGIKVFCDMETDGGGWTVFQNRFEGSVDFYRSFEDYEQGFGDLVGEFWLGLRYIHTMTKDVRTQLRIDLEAASGNTAYQTFDNFFLSEGPNYTLNIDPGVGTAGDKKGLSYSKGRHFIAKGPDKGYYSCASRDRGGWWYDSCAYANLNGEYVTPGTLSTFNNGEGGMTYRDFDGVKSLKKSKMMFRQVK